MSRVAYVNGRFQPIRAASIDVEDRGFQFGDAVYEVWAVRDGELLDAEAHFARLTRSLGEIRIIAPMERAALTVVLHETLRRNRVRDGIVYLQISRGAAPREHAFPKPDVPPTIVVTAKATPWRVLDARAANGVAVVTVPETRWARRDIKTVNLLPNVLAKQAAHDAGAFEAWFCDSDGLITEGTSTNAWIVDAAGVLRTAPRSNAILHGVTRAAILSIAQELQMQVCEEPFSRTDALAAREAFMTSASNIAVPVISIDGKTIGGGAPGTVAKRLRDAYFSARGAPR